MTPGIAINALAGRRRCLGAMANIEAGSLRRKSGDHRMDSTSSILAFRAVTFLAEEFALRFNSRNLRMLSGEMEPASGHPCGDQALAYVWQHLWGEQAQRTPEEAASIAIAFLEQEGDWGDDDGHRRLAEGLKQGPEGSDEEIWLAWRYCLDKARQYREPGAWCFAEQPD